MSALLRALGRARGHHEALALAAVLTLAVVLRALAGALALAGVPTNAFRAGRLRRRPARRCRSRVLRHCRGSQKQRRYRGGKNCTPRSLVHRFLLFRQAESFYLPAFRAHRAIAVASANS